MTKTDGRRSAQGNRPRPGFELWAIPDNEVVPGQSERDLGLQWGAQGKDGPRTTRRGARVQNIPSGLEMAQDELESQQQRSLDQPDMGGDWLDDHSLDQTGEVGDRRASPDQSSKEGSDWQSHSLDQASRADEQQESGLEYASDEGGTYRAPRSEGSFIDWDDGTPGQGTEGEEIGTPCGLPPDPRGWRKVTRKVKSWEERSEGSRDVEDLLANSGSDDGSRYIKKWFDKTKHDNGPDSDDAGPENTGRSLRTETKKRKRQEKKPKKAHGKIDEPPAFPRGFGDQLSSVSRFGRDDTRKTGAGAPTPVTAKLDRRNVPSGVHFNKAGGNQSRGRHSNRNK